MEVHMTPDILALVTAVLAILNGEIASPIIAWLKAKLKVTGGIPAFALTVGEIAAVTAGYLLFVTKNFTIGTFALAVVYGVMRASGIYTVTKAT
jgi:hypothetical protein